MKKKNEMPSSDTLWQRIREARISIGASQGEIAEVCNTSVSAVSQWEAEDIKRRTQPDYGKLVKFAKFTHRSTDWLLTGQEFALNDETQHRQEIDRILKEIVKERNLQLSERALQRLSDKIYQQIKKGKSYSRNTLAELIELFI